MNSPITELICNHILDKISDFLILTSLEGNIKLLNKPLLNALKCKKEDLIDKPVSIIFATDELFQTMKFDKPQLITLNYNNKKIPIQLSSTVIFDAEDTPTDILIIARDLRETSKLASDIELLKKNIRKSEEETTTKISLLSDALASVGESVFITDIYQRIIYCNKRGMETFNYDWNEFIGKEAEILYKTNDKESFRGSWRGEVIAMRKGKEKFPALLTTSSVKNKVGKEIGFVGVFQDITELKKLVDELEKASVDLEKRVILRTEELEKSRNLWEKTFNSIEDLVSIHDREDKIIRVNKAAAKKLNATPSELEGKDCCSLFMDENLSRNECPCHEVLKTQKTVQKEINSKKLDGTFTFSVSPIFNEREELEGLVHIVTDITKRKHLEEQLLHSTKMAAIGTLAAGITHEVNNPLTIIMGYCHILLNNPLYTGEIRNQLTKIYEQVNRAKKIIYNLSVFARSHKSEKRYIDLIDLMEKTLELRSYDLQRKNISIYREFQNNLPCVYVDGNQIQQVFFNLINNTIDAILSVKNQGKITIKIMQAQDKIRTVFADDGCGINPEDIPKIFDPFYTTKEIGKGTGLGLSISYGIIKDHNGNINVQSQPGEGTSFIIELPVASIIPFFTSQKEEKTEDSPETTTCRSKANILIVDDEELIAEILISSLKKYGFNVESSLDGHKALEMIKGIDFDLIISDYRMPDLSGEKLYEDLLEHKAELAKKLIYITGDTTDESILSFVQKRNIKLLHKPFDINKLIETINELLNE